MPVIFWTDDEEKILISNYEEKGYAEIAKMVGKNMDAVKKKAYMMGLCKREGNTQWSEEQIEFIRNNYDKMLYKDIAEKLGVTEKRVFLQAQRMGLSKERVTVKTGDRIHNSRLVVLGMPFIKGKPGQTKSYVRCKCDCGTETEVKVCDLVNGRTKSCGCLQREAVRKPRQKKHGLCDSPLYRSWIEMRSRSKELNLEFSDKWNEFIDFHNWAISQGYEEGKTRVFRMNILQGYGPENCFVRRTKGE